MRTLQRTSLLVIALLFGVSACVLPAISFEDPSVQATSLAMTVQVMVAGTQGANPTATLTSTPGILTPSPFPTFTASPSETFTPSLTLSPTVTSTATPSSTPFPTSTPVNPSISVSVPTNCRTGPGKVYPMVGALLVGEFAQVIARDPTGQYWYIPNPDSPGEYCWVWGEYATISGPWIGVPIYTPRATPTPSFTPTPQVGFDTSFDELRSCSGDWWVSIRLINTGDITFESITISVRDTDTDVTVSSADNEFVNRTGCSSSSSRDALGPGKSTTVTSPEISDNPTGHKLRVTLTLCSRDGQEGKCQTDTITFKP